MSAAAAAGETVDSSSAVCMHFIKRLGGLEGPHPNNPSFLKARLVFCMSMIELQATAPFHRSFGASGIWVGPSGKSTASKTTLVSQAGDGGRVNRSNFFHYHCGEYLLLLSLAVLQPVGLRAVGAKLLPS